MIEGKIGAAGDQQDTRQVEVLGMKPILRTSETKDGKRQILDTIRDRLA